MHPVIATSLVLTSQMFASCTSDRSPTPEPAGPDPEGSVTIRVTAGLQFQPSNVTIAPGTTVRWVNDAAIFHTVTADSGSQPGVWSRRSLNTAGETFSHTFARSGETYTYHCEPHVNQGMRGTIRVQ